MLKYLVVSLISVFSVFAYATAPKQVCHLEKDVLVLSQIDEMPVVVTPYFLNPMTKEVFDGTAETLQFEKVAGSQASKLVISKTFASVMYERSLSYVTISYGDRYSEKIQPLSYQEGQAAPFGSLVCYQYAN